MTALSVDLAPAHEVRRVEAILAAERARFAASEPEPRPLPNPSIEYRKPREIRSRAYKNWRLSLKGIKA